MKTMNEWLLERVNDGEEISKGKDPNETEMDDDDQPRVDLTDPVNIGNKEIKKTSENPNPFRHRDPNKPITVVIDFTPSLNTSLSFDAEPSKKPQPKQWVWTFRGDNVTGKMKKKSLKESVVEIQQIESLVEEVFLESKLAGGVGLVGLNDLKKAKTTLQKVLTILSQPSTKPMEKLDDLIKSIGILTKGMIEVTAGQQKVLGESFGQPRRSNDD